jgi:hypothetical protein
MTRHVATGIAVDGGCIVIAAADIEVLVTLAPSELVALAGELLQAARRATGREHWPPTTLSHPSKD